MGHNWSFTAIADHFPSLAAVHPIFQPVWTNFHLNLFANHHSRPDKFLNFSNFLLFFKHHSFMNWIGLEASGVLIRVKQLFIFTAIRRHFTSDSYSSDVFMLFSKRSLFHLYNSLFLISNLPFFSWELNFFLSLCFFSKNQFAAVTLRLSLEIIFTNSW